MQTVKCVDWQENGGYLGQFLEYPDYWTQGESLDELKEHLLDLYHDLTKRRNPRDTQNR
jgi:predicted RNase H-like HicB family nuclease